jgi:glyoxylate reductase
MKILYIDAFQNETLEQELGAEKVEFETLLEQADFVSVHLPLLPVVNEAELLDALKQGEIAGACLDVYEYEPKMVKGLKDLDNVVITPHTASTTISSRGSMARIAAENLLAMLEGKEAPNCVNPEVYK